MQRVVPILSSASDTEAALCNLTKEGKLAHVLNAKDKHGDTLAHFAARDHYLPTLRLLHDYGASMEAVNDHGRCTAVFPGYAVSVCNHQKQDAGHSTKPSIL